MIVSHYNGGRALWHKCVSAFLFRFDVGYFLSCVRYRSHSTSFCSFIMENWSLWSYMYMCVYVCVCVCIYVYIYTHIGFPVDSDGKNILPAMQETWTRSLGWEDPLEGSMATHSSIVAGKIPWTEEPGGLQSMGLQRVGHDWACLHLCQAFVVACGILSCHMWDLSSLTRDQTHGPCNGSVES